MTISRIHGSTLHAQFDVLTDRMVKGLERSRRMRYEMTLAPHEREYIESRLGPKDWWSLGDLHRKSRMKDEPSPRINNT